MRKIILTGALVGGLLTASLTALSALANQLAGLPFVPFSFFDWQVRVLPAFLINFGKNTMEGVVIGVNGVFHFASTDTVAKISEHMLAISLFVIFGIIAGAIFYAILQRRAKPSDSTIPGIVFGLVCGVPLALINNSVDVTSPVGPMTGAFWIVVIFAVWGWALQGIYNRLYVPLSSPLVRNAAPEDRPALQAIDRRQFLVRFGAATATITVLGAGLTSLLGNAGQSSEETLTPEEIAHAAAEAAALPNAADTLQPAPGTRPEYTPLSQHYRIDINSLPPDIQESDWSLQISGLVDNPMNMTLDQIKAYPSQSAYITMSCISNWVGGDLISTTKWTGVSMKRILADLKPKSSATHMKITAVDGFDETLALDAAKADDRIMLAYAWDDQPLRARHGFPLRIHIPDHFGMKQPKWITTIEFIDHDEDGYWVRRGWDKEAQVRATSVIDVVASNALIADAANANQQLVPIGGIAWAGARGVSKVEVQVDGGDWVEAKMRQPLSERTWVIWRYDWPFESGSHTFAVRTYEGDGTPQIVSVAGTAPSGATGIFSMSEML